jgi:hypothetical protein
MSALLGPSIDKLRPPYPVNINISIKFDEIKGILDTYICNCIFMRSFLFIDINFHPLTEVCVDYFHTNS